MSRFRTAAQIALTALLAVVVGLGVLGSSRLASACMRLSLREAPCCAAMRAPVRLQGENSCCHGGRLESGRPADPSEQRVEISHAAAVPQPSWSDAWLAAVGGVAPAIDTLERNRPPPRARHLTFTILRC